ncbi:unnamed protein product [Ectocarpus sp. 4 AP-2014]
MVFIVGTLLLVAAATAIAAAAVASAEACMPRRSRDDDDGQELAVAEPRRRDICIINNSSGSLGCRPFLLQLPGGRQVRVDSVQSALRLYSRISSRSVPQQQLGGVPRPIAQRIFRRRGWTGRSSMTSINGGGGIFAQLRFPSTFSAVMPPPLALVRGCAGADGAIVLSTPAAAAATAAGSASRVFSMCPLLLPGLSSATAGGGTQTVLSLQQQLLTLSSTASVFSGSSGAIRAAVWCCRMSVSQHSVAARWVSEAMCGPLDPPRELGAFGTIHGPLSACWGTAAAAAAAVAAAARPLVVARVAVTGNAGAAYSPYTPSSTGASSFTDTSKVGDRFSRGGSVPAISPADWALPAWSSALSSSSSAGAREGADKTGAAASTVGEQPSCPMLASLRERLESGPVPSAFRFAGRGRGCPPHLSASLTCSGTAAGTATEHGAAAAAAAAAGAVPAATYGACAAFSGYASHVGGDKRDRYVLENMDLLDDADENEGAAAAASCKDDDDGKTKTGAIYGNQCVDQSGAEALMGIGGRPSLQVMRVSVLDAALKPSSVSSDSTEEEEEGEASPTESKRTQRYRCEKLDTDEEYLAKIDAMTQEVSSVLQKTLAAAASVAPPTPPLTPASTMSSPADSFHGSTRAVFFGSDYNEKDSGVIFESVNEDSLLLPQVVPRSPGVVDIPPPRFPSPRVYLTADGLDMNLCILDGVNSDGGFGDVVFVKDKATKESFAFKTSKDTPAGRRQMEREVAALSDVRGKVSHVVHVQEISSTSGVPMLLMRREPGTVSSMLSRWSNTDPRALVR